MKSNVLKVGKGCINEIFEILKENHIDGKILYVSDSVVDGLYGSTVKSQLSEMGKVKEEFVDYNTISYAMSSNLFSDNSVLLNFYLGTKLEFLKISDVWK